MNNLPFFAQAQTMQADHDINDAFPWWVRLFAKVLGIFSGIVAIFFGIFGTISSDPFQSFAAFMQIFGGVLIIGLEAPFCCAFNALIDRIAKYTEGQPYWLRALFYFLVGVFPLLIRMTFLIFFSSILIFGAAIVYGFMALGKKADRNTMMSGKTDQAWNIHVDQPTPRGFNQP